MRRKKECCLSFVRSIGMKWKNWIVLASVIVSSIFRFHVLPPIVSFYLPIVGLQDVPTSHFPQILFVVNLLCYVFRFPYLHSFVLGFLYLHSFHLLVEE